MNTIELLKSGGPLDLKEPANGTTAGLSGCDAKDGPVLLTVKQLAAYPKYPFSEASLRHLIFLSEPRVDSRGEEIPGNGLNKAIIRLGRRVLIDVEAFDRWLDDHRYQG